MFTYKVGDLVVLLETIEWNDRIGLKGEICIVTQIFDRNLDDDDIFFDYKVCTADGVPLDVWEGEIEGLKDA